MEVQTFCGGMVGTNGYLALMDKTAFLFDAPEGISEWLGKQKISSSIQWAGLFLTHGHWDHIVEAALLQKEWKMPVFIHRDSAPLLEDPSLQMAYNPFCRVAPCKPNRILNKEDSITEKEISIQLLLCPGHCPGSLCFYFQNEKIIFGGDVLFAGGVGRWDLPGGSEELLFDSIAKNILTLPDETRIYPGHGPSTTIGRERKSNPYIRGIG